MFKNNYISDKIRQCFHPVMKNKSIKCMHNIIDTKIMELV